MVPEDTRAVPTGGSPPTEVVLLREGAEVASWPLILPRRPDLAIVDELARLQLAAGRIGCSIWLRRACPELVGLLDLVGLGAVVPCGPCLQDDDGRGPDPRAPAARPDR